MNKPNNPLAFPQTNMLTNIKTRKDELVCSGGMTLLDYFAGQILTGVFSNDAFYYRLVTESKDGDLSRERYLAEHCYIYAQAMLEEREEQCIISK